MEKNMTIKDSHGDDRPVTLIDQSTLDRHLLVEAVFSNIVTLVNIAQETIDNQQNEINEYLVNCAKKSKIKELKGDVTLTNFSQTLKISLKTNDIITFNENINIAKSKIDECIKKWAKDNKDDEKAKFITVLVMKAFRVDKKGNINKNRIMDLVKVTIPDPDFIEAQKLIQKSIEVSVTKRYMNFYKRNEKGKWELLSLNFSCL